LSDGVLYKANATTWSKSVCKKFSASAVEDGIVKHANATTWFKNYPMEQYYTQTFSATWSQGWKGDGTRLDEGVWQENILVGSAASGFRGMLGFNQSAIQSFLGSGSFGNVTSAKLWVNCYETSSTGSPDVQIGKHSYSSKPAGTWTGQNTDWGDLSSLHVPNQALGGYMITLNPTQITLADGHTAIGGFALRAESNTDENYGKFNGVLSYNSQLEITVLK
jgi:hypothetical protein